VTDPVTRILFVDTANASRSILAEALVRRAGGERFVAVSAGTHPTTVHPLTRRVLEESGLDHAWARSKPVDDFVGQPFDYVITLCDDARLICPVFPGADQSFHWAYGEPASVEGDEAARLVAFQHVYTDLGKRIRQFLLIADRTPSAAVG
jgi:arsenate reductase